MQHKLLSPMMIVSIIATCLYEHSLLLFFSNTDAEIGFEQVMFVVQEDIQIVTICIASTVELERTVSVDITVSIGSVESKYKMFSNQKIIFILCIFHMPLIFFVIGEDYVAQTFQPLVFTADEVQNCINIEIVDDTIVEPNENFSLVLSTSEERVTLSPDSAEIIILDNDCKLH